ncbi:MAG TPA: phage holin family protein [Steroidobacter sp.]|nr:phage holin family protein [Steroidobacteraceae bacterium]HLS81680.1 phage holin family protein [Steroidobacter sp.]
MKRAVRLAHEIRRRGGERLRKEHSMTAFILRVAIVALGLWLAAQMLQGLQFDSTGALLAAALLLGVVNAVVRPIAVILTLPLTLLTLGLFLLVVNAAMMGLVALLLSGFHISGFWTAVGGSLVVSIVSWAASGLIGDSGRFEVMAFRK